MILIIRVNGEALTYSPRDTDEAVQRLVELHRNGAEVDYWAVFPEGKPWGE